MNYRELIKKLAKPGLMGQSHSHVQFEHSQSHQSTKNSADRLTGDKQTRWHFHSDGESGEKQFDEETASEQIQGRVHSRHKSDRIPIFVWIVGLVRRYVIQHVSTKCSGAISNNKLMLSGSLWKITRK